MYPIWKDTYYSNYFETLEYYLKDVDEDKIVHQAYTKKMPGWTGVTLNINNMVDEHLKPDFAEDFTQVSDAVVANPNAYKRYQLKSAGGGNLGNYDFLYDWSYKDDWTGQTAHNMSTPVKHLDPRMKAMFTIFNTAETEFDYSIEYNVYTRFIPRQIFFGVSGGTRSVDVITNDGWEITSMPEWLDADVTAGTGSYSAESDTVVTFTATANAGAENREGVIEFTNSDGVARYCVTQAGVLSFDVTPDSVSLEASGGTVVITIDTNSEWTVISSPVWVSLSQTSGGSGVSIVTATASTNNSFYNTRQDNIVIVSGGKRQGVCIRQNRMEPVVGVSPSFYVFEYTGGTMELTVDSNIDWYITSYPKWATLSVLSGDVGSTVVTVTVDENRLFEDLVGHIAFQDGLKCKITDKVTLTLKRRELPAISITPSSYEYPNTGGTKVFTVTSNVNWQLTNKPQWLTVSRQSGGAGETTISTTAQTNTTFNDRQGTLTVSGEGGVSDSATIVSKSIGMTLSASTSSIDVPAIGGTTSFTVTSNYGWSASTDLGITPTSGGSGTTTVTLTLPDNTGVTISDSIILYNRDNIEVINITQPGGYDAIEQYLRFDITSAGYIQWCMRHRDDTQAPLAPHHTIQYRKNFGNWTTIASGGTSPKKVTVAANDVIEFRGDNDTYALGTNGADCFAKSTAGFKVSGNIMSMISSTNFSAITTMPDSFALGNFIYFFEDCTGLTDASCLVLPATALYTTHSAYEGSATYGNMFKGCTSLVKGPLVLPATDLTMVSYGSMFQGCTSLTTAPTLPATTLTNSCYSYMFSGCTSLTTGPVLPAETLVSGCYSHMFDGCTSLTGITCLCTSDTTTIRDCTHNWVCNVGKNGVFTNIGNVKWTRDDNGIPDSWTTAQPLPEITNTLKFNIQSDGYIGWKWVEANPYYRHTQTPITYRKNGGSWTNLPAYASGTTISVVNGDVLEFYGTNEYYGYYDSAVYKYDHTKFYGTAQFSVEGNISSILTNGSLSETGSIFYGMFSGTSVTSASGLSLPLNATTGCYHSMFKDCALLEDAPVLPATTLTADSYNSMFANCSSLNNIKCLATDISASGCTTNWVDGVASQGTFTKDSSMSAWTTGVDGIPNGWTVTNA